MYAPKINAPITNKAMRINIVFAAYPYFSFLFTAQYFT